MCTSWASCAVLLYLVLFLTPCCPILVTALPAPSYLTPNASTSWTNSLSAPDSVKFDDGSFARIILAREFDHYFYKIGCGCGFFYNQTRNTHVFAIFTLSYVDGDAVNISSNDPKVVWFANPENSFSINATLQLTSEKGLVLKDANGTTVWSTNIFSKSVAALNFTDMCNLQLLDDKSSTVWQSSDHPTDTLVVGQKLVAGQQLTSQGGLFSLHVTRQGIFAYVSSNPPQRYFTYTSDNTSYIQFLEDRMTFSSNTNKDFPLPSSNFFPNWFMRLEADNGRLKVYDTRWGEVFDFFDRLKVLPCLFPTVCGNYGICSNGQCSCPRPTNATSYFQATEETQPDHGCSLITPLSCEASKNHILLELQNITYFPFTQDHPAGLPTRYAYDDLHAITENFNKELGGGGFGTVFEGTLPDGTKVAVKRLDGFSQIQKSFLAEVETIGSIHHINLVRLIGFCAEKCHRLLVYEYMSNGSLDGWVFHQNLEMVLDWQHRKKIVLDVARGLTYLHEECRQKIVHLDIKPQNILLDENFNAKVSDFGLSKLVDHDQSRVVTNMRGTPGYMAPEWLSLVITEKVDVYSFGVVLLEILCGRRNLDRSQPEEAMHLLDLFRKNIEEDQLLDLVDKYSEDMQLHRAEVVSMMRVAAWCLQNDFTRRPSMSMVVKVLEGDVNVESDLDYFFSNPSLPNMRAGVENQEVHIVTTTPLLPSVLSGPR
ncbi:rust resistance kinase Lr10-like isoform X1 [Quercus suber]|uniref:rust resistance kinase Lr10-like isoform X1 n=1 Tax=Quercus suber TaxID=58331 RepID=UPI0032DE326C